jgi:hypothetical protein
MFFRRERPKTLTFDERMERLRQAGFAVASSGAGMRVSRNGLAVDVINDSGQPRVTGRAGLLMGDEIGVLIDEGYQKFFKTPSGKKRPALAQQLKALHDLEEDLKEALGQESLYNESLGTVSTYYIYDRVKGRDRGVKRIWD